MRFSSSLGILGIIGFCLGISIYVSIPDYPYEAYPWALMLWGEKSQWWSEITWVVLFGIFGVLSILLVEWNRELRRGLGLSFMQALSRFVFLIILISLSFHFSALYFEWHGWYSTLVLDKGGFLHGLFYLWTFVLGLFCFSELTFLVSGIVRAVSSPSREGTVVTKPRNVIDVTMSRLEG